MLKEKIKKEMENMEDFKLRFQCEYYSLAIRYEKLKSMLENWDNLSFTPQAPKNLYIMQLEYMFLYKTILEARAIIDQIEL